MEKKSFGVWILEIMLGLATAVLFIGLVTFFSDAFIPHPDFQALRNECYQPYVPVRPGEPVPIKGDPQTDVADRQKCADEIMQKERDFQKAQFFVGVGGGVLGVLLVVIAALNFTWFIGAGLMFGGVGSFIFGFASGSSVVDKQIIFFTLVVAILCVMVMAWVFARKRVRM